MHYFFPTRYVRQVCFAARVWQSHHYRSAALLQTEAQRGLLCSFGLAKPSLQKHSHAAEAQRNFALQLWFGKAITTEAQHATEAQRLSDAMRG